MKWIAGPRARAAALVAGVPGLAAHLAAAAALLGLGALFLHAGWGSFTFVLLGAATEEVVFRRELPDALARALEARAGPWSGLVVGTLAAQVIFAACHFLGPAHLRPFGPGQPFARLVAGGTCLSALYRASGTLWLPTAVHCWINATLFAGAA